MKTSSSPLSGISRTLRLACCGFLAFASVAHSAVIIDLTAFDDDVEGSVTGPFTDLVTGVSASFTTTTITDQLGVAGPGNYLDFASAQKGVNNTNFSLQESWTFTLNTDSQFLGIDLSGLANADFAAIQSNAWIGAVITPGSTAVTFNSVTGTFLLDGTLAGDRFTLANLYGISEIPVIAAGTGVRIFSPNETSFALGADFTWNLVPEPSCLALIGLAASLLVARRSRRP